MMNKRYTDIDALIELLRCNIDLPFNNGDSWPHIVQIKDKLIEHIEKNAPIANVVEPPVRCRDCKHARVMTRNESAIYVRECVMCMKISIDGRNIPMFPQDFCSYGERKDGADNGN